MQQQTSSKLGMINSIGLLLVTIAALFLSHGAQTTAGLAAVLLLGIGTVIGFFAFVHSHLIGRERQEELEMQALDQSRGDQSLFAGAAEDAYPARNARRQFEKWVVPGFTVLVLLGQAFGLLWLYVELTGNAEAGDAGDRVLSIMFFALFMIILFMMGKYSAGLARMDGQELLRPAANYMLLGSVACTAVVASLTASHLNDHGWDDVIAWILFAVVAIAALENGITLILEIYRPRVDGKKARLIYDSRLIGLLGQPGGLISTAAQAMDYQFGFKVSETWFYRYIEQKLALILAIQFGVLFLSSSFVVIHSNEKALLERNGEMQEEELIPGFYLKLPWPIDKVYRFKTDQIQSFTLGVVDNQHNEAKPESSEVLLWTTPHNHGSATDQEQNFNMIVASRNADAESAAGAVPMNLLTVSIPVHYRINDLKAWITHNANAGSLLQKLAMREVTQFLIGADVDELMGPGRGSAQETLKQQIDAQAKTHNLGAEVLFVGLQDIHPPVGKNEQSKETGGVAEKYEEVIVAQMHAETNRLGAKLYSAGKVPQAHATAAEILARARSESTNKVAIAEAEAKRFANQAAAFRSAPSVYKTRMKLESFKEATVGSRKYILSNPANRDVINLELQDQLRKDLLNVTVEQDN
ncbi:MAG: SPFH domain-containing protein [Verrucomicrobiota bacterium]|jgi:regulator of protease activity HflC (stomatin/prohibitin superfamily)|nr:SPFH domain-containing protein [Verrucomicrobiota bacterium]